MLARPQERVDFEVYNRLFEFGEQALADPLFGFHVGCDIEAGDYGVLGYLVMNCNSLEQAIDYLSIRPIVPEGTRGVEIRSVRFERLPD